MYQKKGFKMSNLFPLENLINAGIERQANQSKCGYHSIGKKPNPNCFSSACEFCQFCGACNATMKYEKFRFCDAECEQDWKLVPNT